MPKLDPILLAPPPRASRGYSRVADPLAEVSLVDVELRSFPSSPAARAGSLYERRVGQRLSVIAKSLGLILWDHQTISVGGSVAEPDFVLVSPAGAGILIEVKYTWEDTSAQRAFYTSLLKSLGISPITSVTICRNLLPSTPPDSIVRDFYSIFEGAVWQLHT